MLAEPQSCEAFNVALVAALHRSGQEDPFYAVIS